MVHKVERFGWIVSTARSYGAINRPTLCGKSPSRDGYLCYSTRSLTTMYHLEKVHGCDAPSALGVSSPLPQCSLRAHSNTIKARVSINQVFAADVCAMRKDMRLSVPRTSRGTLPQRHVGQATSSRVVYFQTGLQPCKPLGLLWAVANPRLKCLWTDSSLNAPFSLLPLSLPV